MAAHCMSRAWRAGKGGFVQDEQLSHWYAYVAWEASNVQRLDQAALAARVVLAYEQVMDPQSLTRLDTAQCTLVWQHADEHRCCSADVDLLSTASNLPAGRKSS